MWESVILEALIAMRSLLCTAINDTPHNKFFSFVRRESRGTNLSLWLSAGKKAGLRNLNRNNDDPFIVPVTIDQVINPYFARVRKEDGRLDTVSTTSQL